MFKRLVLLCLLLSVKSYAGTITLDTGWTQTVSDFSCQTVISAFLVQAASTSGDCQYQAVGPGTVLTFRNSGGGRTYVSTVASVTGWSVPPSSSVNYQPQIDALVSRITALESAVTAINAKLAAAPVAGHTLTDTEYAQFASVMTSANTPYDYNHGGLLFAAVLGPTLGLYFLVRGLMEFFALSRLSRRVV
ncbi:hypothetical protein [uncultured Dechloromonas sp.]|uniref:hypothetical protein n=1 Tax=uncultured Dechloromonas sp. TaxID=171719 RepID=UPI0025FEB2D4|nr:hypothetical protein [uncultured Dechloromonas sp.]